LRKKNLQTGWKACQQAGWLAGLPLGPFCRKGFSPQGEPVAGCSVCLFCIVAVSPARPIWTWQFFRSLVAASREVLLGKQDLLQ